MNSAKNATSEAAQRTKNTVGKGKCLLTSYLF